MCILCLLLFKLLLLFIRVCSVFWSIIQIFPFHIGNELVSEQDRCEFRWKDRTMKVWELFSQSLSTCDAAWRRIFWRKHHHFWTESKVNHEHVEQIMGSCEITDVGFICGFWHGVISQQELGCVFCRWLPWKHSPPTPGSVNVIILTFTTSYLSPCFQKSPSVNTKIKCECASVTTFSGASVKPHERNRCRKNSCPVSVVTVENIINKWRTQCGLWRSAGFVYMWTIRPTSCISAKRKDAGDLKRSKWGSTSSIRSVFMLWPTCLS